MKRKVIWMTVSMLMILGLLGGGVGFAAPPIKLGVTVCLTGGHAAYGNAHLDGANLYWEALNAAGGINGRQIQLVVKNNESKAEVAVIMFEQLAADREIVAIHGSGCSGTGLAVKPVAFREKLPHCASAMALDFSKFPGADYSYRIVTTDKACVETGTYAATKKMGMTKIALLHGADSYGEAFREALRIASAKYGAVIVGEEKCATTDTDLSVQLIALKAKKPEIVFVGGMSPTPGYAAKSAYEIGWDIPLFGTGPVCDPSAVRLPADKGEGFIFANPFAPDEMAPGIQTEFFNAYKKKFGDKPFHAGAGFYYSGGMVLGEAIKRAAAKGEITRESIKRALDQLEIMTPCGLIKYTPTDHEGPSPESVVIGRIKGGKFLIWNPKPIKSRTQW